MERLKTYFHENARKNLLYMGELLNILELFESKGITAIPYKGPVLAIQTYGNLAFREFDDLDIFIEQNDFLKVKKILANLDYFPSMQNETSIEKEILESQRECKFLNQSKKINLEIKWKFAGMLLNVPNEDKFLDKNSLKFTIINGKTIIEPSPEDMLLILCLHNAGHRWNRLLWILDVAQIIQNYEIEWSKLILKSNNRVLRKILFLNIYIVQELFKVELPREILNAINSEVRLENLALIILNKIFRNNIKFGLIDEAMLSLKLREKISYGVKDLIKGLFKPTTNEFSNLSLSKRLFFLYYLYRPISILKKYKFF